MSKVLLVEDRGAVRALTMNRPDRRNALDTALTTALLEALRAADDDDDCRVVVLAGNGPSFCAGADTGEFATLSDPDGDAAAARASLTTELHRVFPRLRKPVLAAVHGHALGGGAGLALACDLMVVARDMKLGYPELRHGIVAAVVMANLVRQIGPKAAFALLSTGRTLDGSAAMSLHLAYECVEASRVREQAIGVAETLAAWSPKAMAATKQLFYRTRDLTFDAALDAGRDTNMLMRSFKNAGSRA